MKIAYFVSVLSALCLLIFSMPCPAADLNPALPRTSPRFRRPWANPGGVGQYTPVPSEEEESVEAIADPLEPVNRGFFQFNDKLYFWILKPVASGYKAIIPEDGRVGVRNFFSNLTTPIRLVNCLFQGRFKAAGNEAVRFLLNTGLGWLAFWTLRKKNLTLKNRKRISARL